MTAFGVLNFAKTEKNSQLSATHTEDILRIKLNGPEINQIR